MTKVSTWGQRGKTAEQRFWEKVRKTGGCWEWTSATQGSGYGVFWLGGGKSENAHRFAWSVVNGPVPAGMVVMHLCNNKGCVNPSHLQVGTPKENALMAAKDGLVYVGERNGGGGKLTEQAVREVLADKSIGCWRAAKKYGVSKTTILAIRSRRIWKHVNV